jgi:hypothetical protein
VTGKREDVDGLESGTLETFMVQSFRENGASSEKGSPERRDGKSGALVLEY